MSSLSTVVRCVFRGTEEIVYRVTNTLTNPYTTRYEIWPRVYRPNIKDAQPTLGEYLPLTVIERAERVHGKP